MSVTAYGKVVVRGEVIGLARMTVERLMAKSLDLSLEGKPVKGRWEILGMTEEEFKLASPCLPEVSVL